MQRIKIVLTIFISLFLVVGCSSTKLEKINYESNILELNEYGKEVRKWYPISGSIYVKVETDELIFIDRYTNKKHVISSSYKLIGK
jgi:hypothetical protein